MYKYLTLCYIFFLFLIRRRLSFLKTFLVIPHVVYLLYSLLWRQRAIFFYCLMAVLPSHAMLPWRVPTRNGNKHNLGSWTHSFPSLADRRYLSCHFDLCWTYIIIMVVDPVNKSNYVSLHCIFPQLFVRYNTIKNELVAGDSAFLSFLSTLETHCWPRLVPTVFPQVDKMHWHPQQGHYLYILNQNVNIYTKEW